MRTKTVAAAALALIALAGCGHKDYSQTHFQSTADLAKLIDWTCSSAGSDADNLGKYGFSSIPCDDGSITLFNSDAKRDELESAPQNALKSGWCRIDGGNWSVSGSQYKVEDAEKILGGTKTCA